MKKNKSKSVFSGVLLVIFSAGIFLGVFRLLFFGIVQKNGYPQVSQASPPATPHNPIPFVCQSCNVNIDLGNRLRGKDLTNAYFAHDVGRTFIGDINGAVDLSNTTFVNVNLSVAVIGGNSEVGVNFTSDDFSNANLTQIQTGGDNNFTNANFTNANLTGSFSSGDNFSGAIWSNTTCPDGTNSNNDGNTCDGHGA